jgi:predicted esterase
MADPSRHLLRVERTARLATLGSPSAAATWWVVLHGYGQLAEDIISHFDSFVTPDRAIIAPEALSRFYVDGLETHEQVGASWMTRAAREDEINDYVAYLNRIVEHFSPAGTSPSIRVLGFSQGAATASRWAVLGNTAVDRLVLWGGAPASDLDLEKHAGTLRQMDLTLVAGTDDPYVTPERRAAVEQQLAKHDIPVTLHTFEGGHQLTSDVLEQLLTASLS